MNVTYIKLIQIIESFSSEHLEIRRFKSDFLEQMQNFGTETEAYPILYVTPNNNVFNNNTFSDTNVITLDFYCVDIIQKDRANINTILSVTNNILNDVHKYFKDGEIAGIDVLTASVVAPLNNYLMDYVAGWQMTITFEVDTYSVCEIPFENSPVLPIGECDTIYSRFLTCDSLANCSTFTSGLQVLQDQITVNTNNIDQLETDLSDLDDRVSINEMDIEELNTQVDWTIELIDVLTTDFYAPFNMQIDSIVNILNTPITTLLLNGFSYTLSDPINSGDKITVTVDTAAVITLKSIKI